MMLTVQLVPYMYSVNYSTLLHYGQHDVIVGLNSFVCLFDNTIYIQVYPFVRLFIAYLCFSLRIYPSIVSFFCQAFFVYLLYQFIVSLSIYLFCFCQVYIICPSIYRGLSFCKVFYCLSVYQFVSLSTHLSFRFFARFLFVYQGLTLYQAFLLISLSVYSSSRFAFFSPVSVCLFICPFTCVHLYLTASLISCKRLITSTGYNDGSLIITTRKQSKCARVSSFCLPTSVHILKQK